MNAGDFDAADFIESTLTQIVNGKNAGLIRDRYRHNAKLLYPAGKMKYGREALLADVLSFLAAFPDCELKPEDTISAAGRKGELKTSTRWRLSGRYTGDGTCGWPAESEVAITGITNCRIHNERIVQQWIEYDKRSLLTQLGTDEYQCIEDKVNGNEHPIEEEEFSTVLKVEGEIESSFGQLPAENASSIELINVFWNSRNFGDVDGYYSPDCTVHAGSGRELQGTAELKQWFLSLIAPFPDSVWFVDDLIREEGASGTSKQAFRWTIAGTHRSTGMYGPPTGEKVLFTGITQQLLTNTKIQEEWTEFSELDVVEKIEMNRYRAACEKEQPPDVQSEDN